MYYVITCALLLAAEPFTVQDIGPENEAIARIAPWKSVMLEAEYGGQWVVAGDLDLDGSPEIVSAENFNEGDTHYTSAVAVQKLDGTLLWTWGAPDKGRKVWHHDVACQIHDWDGDGNAEVVLCGDGAIVALDGRTGAEKRRIPIAKDASDCLVFCDLSGSGRPTDVLVKSRYEQIWAYDAAGSLLWTSKLPGGQRTAHQPRPLDLDGDGKDEIFAGYALLNRDGTVRWIYKSDKIDLARGHLDCARVLVRGAKPEDWRIAMTCCGANALVLADGNGRSLWEVGGYHFESINIGTVSADVPGPHIVVDVDHQPEGNSPIWILDRNGNKLGEIATRYSRHHKLVDWTGDGACELVVGGNRALYDGKGERLATFAVPEAALESGAETSVLTGDMNGDGVLDVLIVTPSQLFVYRNESKSGSDLDIPLGTGLNVTLY